MTSKEPFSHRWLVQAVEAGHHVSRRDLAAYFRAKRGPIPQCVRDYAADIIERKPKRGPVLTERQLAMRNLAVRLRKYWLDIIEGKVSLDPLSDIDADIEKVKSLKESNPKGEPAELATELARDDLQQLFDGPLSVKTVESWLTARNKRRTPPTE